MIFQFLHLNKTYSFDSNVYHDLSMPIRDGEDNPNAYYIIPPKIEPFCVGSFVGSVAQGGACNCEDIYFNAHGNGTHTEGIGHITEERIPIFNALKETLILARVVSISPSQLNDDFWISTNQLQKIDLEDVDALVIRTLPNSNDKKHKKYSGANPVYLDPEFTKALAQNGIEHLLLDLPSVDKEEDDGALLSHKAFWQYPESPRMNATITELIFVPDSVKDGLYLLNIQIASFDSDASPSRPILFDILPS
jgi:arylformamidase